MAQHYLHRPDYWLQFSLLLIVVIGLLMLSSASAAVGFERFGDAYHFLKHQLLVGLLPGLVIFWFLSRLDYHRYLRFVWPWGLLTLFLLVSVFIPGLGTTLGKSAKSWVGLFGLTMQPAEAAKLIFVLFFSAWLAQKGEAVKNLWLGALPSVVILGLVLGLLAAQPDYGTMFIFLLSGVTIYFVAEARWRHLLILGFLGVFLLVGLVKLSPHAALRLETFLNPQATNLQEQGYQIDQSLLGIGSGGLWGRGLTHSRQKFQYLPEVYGDSIFAVIAEEMGFLFSTFLLILFLIFFSRALRIAKNASDKLGQLLAAGLTAWLVGQTFLNVGGMLGLLPLTGLPLPFISVGGTALVASLAAAGILVNISRQTAVR